MKISDLVESLLQAGCHLASLLLLRAEHRVAPQLLLHLAALVPGQKCESLKGKKGLENTCISSRRPGDRMGGQCNRSPWEIKKLNQRT